MAGEKSLQQKLRDYKRMLLKSDSMTAKMADDIRHKADEIERQLDQQRDRGRSQKVLVDPRQTRPKQTGEMAETRLRLREKRRKYLETIPPRDEAERVSILMLQSRFNLMQKRALEAQYNKLKAERQVRRRQRTLCQREARGQLRAETAMTRERRFV